MVNLHNKVMAPVLLEDYLLPDAQALMDQRGPESRNRGLLPQSLREIGVKLSDLGSRPGPG